MKTLIFIMLLTGCTTHPYHSNIGEFKSTSNPCGLETVGLPSNPDEHSEALEIAKSITNCADQYDFLQDTTLDHALENNGETL